NQPRAGDPGLRSIVAFDLNDAGQVAFLATRDEADQETAVQALDLGKDVLPRTVAATGVAVPGVGGGLIARFGPPAVDASGAIYFAAVCTTTADGSAPAQSYLLRRRGE